MCGHVEQIKSCQIKSMSLKETTCEHEVNHAWTRLVGLIGWKRDKAIISGLI
jgi:hypothetical protein